MTNENHDLSIPLPETVAETEPAELETLTYDEALLRPRPFTFRDAMSGGSVTLGAGPNCLHQPQSGTEPLA